MDDEMVHQVVIVRDGAGEIIHTHQVFNVAGSEPLGEDEILAEAVEAIRRAQPGRNEELYPSVASMEELERHYAETVAGREPRS
jgi:hypothetical protein